LHEKGIEYAHILEGKSAYPIIFDKDDNVLSFPPVINGELTTVTEETKNLFLDLTGTDFAAVNLALNILATTLADMGAKIETVKVIYEDREIVTPNLEPKKWEVSVKYLNNVVGLNLTEQEIIKCFQKVRLESNKSKRKGYLEVLVPAYRGDIMHPVDFTEELGIGYGYINLPTTIREGGIGTYHPIQEASNKIRKIMIGAGYLEVINFILSNSEKQFEYMKQEKDESEVVDIANPVSKEYDTTRKWILPDLMDTLRLNRSEEKPIKLFEVGDVIIVNNEEETGAKRNVHLAGVTYHEDAGFTEIRSTVDFIMTSLGLQQEYEIKANKNPSYIEGRYGDILLNGVKVGEIGEVHPEVLLNYKLEFPVSAFEIDLEKLL
ncbi:MAG: phenylalanine--tRNA ligase subunit beta, partial [Promethearchaeota archaeon]